MKGNEKIIGHLNNILKNELTAINQYFHHARICSDWGLHRIAHKERHESRLQGRDKDTDEDRHKDTGTENDNDTKTDPRH